MESLIHYTFLVLEYCLLPIVLFFFTFKFEEEPSIEEKENYLFNLRGSGYDFVLIEAFSYFSISIRIFSDHRFGTNGLYQNCFVITILVSVALFIIFAIAAINHNIKKPVTVTSFKTTFHSTFVAWWASIIILGIFSDYLLEFRYKGDICLFLFFIASAIGYNAVIKRYFITEEIMFLQYSALVENKEYDKSQKRGFKIIKLLKKKSGLDTFKMLFRLSKNMCYIYYQENNFEKNQKRTAINLMHEIENNIHFQFLQDDMFYKIFAGLYLNIGDQDTALKLISNVDLGRQECIDCINNNCYDKILGTKHIDRVQEVKYQTKSSQNKKHKWLLKLLGSGN